MLECNFVDWLGSNTREKTFSSLLEIELAAHEFFMEVLKRYEKEKTFKKIFSSEGFKKLFEKIFLNELQDTQNALRVDLYAGVGETIKAYNFEHLKASGDLVLFSLNLSEKDVSIAALFIDCTRQDFENLCQQIKERRALMLKLAREERALKRQKSKQKPNKPRTIKRNKRKI